MQRCELYDTAEQLITPAQIHLWLHDLIVISGGNGKPTGIDETIGYLWSCLMTQLEDHRRRGLIEFQGPANNLCYYCELRDIFMEFDVYCKHPENEKTLEGLVNWIERQLNALLFQRHARRKG